MSVEPLWISEAEVVRALHLGEAIDALEAGLRLQEEGRAHKMGKAHVRWGEGDTLHAIGAAIAGDLFGVKTWGHTSGGATPLLILWNAGGRLEAVIEAFALGQMRTGGMSGVATRCLAARDAETLAIVGAGKQAEAQVAAVAAVRRLRSVRVFSPSTERREAFAAKIAGRGFSVEAAASVEAAVSDAAVVTTVTRAREPFLYASMLAPGAHINAVGAITPEREELDIEVTRKAKLIVADDPDAAGRLSQEILRLRQNTPNVSSLHSILDSECVKPSGEGWTIFKSMGSGLADVSLGRAILRTAREQGLGRPFPHPKRAAPRLFPSDKETAL